MSVARFSISAEESLLRKFDLFARAEGYPTRSEALQALMRNALVEKEWESNEEVVGAIALVYDHHHPDLVKQLLDIQHRFEASVICLQHVHIKHDTCLEVLVVKGKAQQINEIKKALNSVKRLKHSGLISTTAGE
jgi:CopG family transcriptional regulator, nickel-responsive regulator